jgi:hypothetical protein
MKENVSGLFASGESALVLVLKEVIYDEETYKSGTRK